MANSTLLELLKEFCPRRGLPVPLIAASSQDDSLLQLIGLLNEVVEDLSTRRVWEKLYKEASFVAVAGDDQGEVSTLAPFGCKWIVNKTFWDRTDGVPVAGPLTSEEWQVLKSSPTTGPSRIYRIRAGHLLVSGAIAGHTMTFEYASEFAIQAADASYKARYSADTDRSLFPDSIMMAGLAYKWRQEKGFDFAEAFARFERLVADFAGHDGTKGNLSMDGEVSAKPGIFVPQGNWVI